MPKKPKPLEFDLAPDELEAFLADANECLQVMEASILGLEQQADVATLNSVFRAAHTLKALAGTVGHRPMAELTHAVETLFEGMREARLEPTTAVADALLAAVDLLKGWRDEIISRQPSGLDAAACLAQLRLLQGSPADPALPLTPARIELTAAQGDQAAELAGAGYSLLEIEVMAGEQAFAPAARLYQAALALLEAGQIVAQQPASDALSEVDRRLVLVLATRSDPETIKNILGEVTDLAAYRVWPFSVPVNSAAEPAEQQPTVAAPQLTSPGPAGNPSKTVRISVERLDSLLNLVGELVTNRTRLLQIEGLLQAEYGKHGSVGALSEMIPHFSHVVAQLQQEVMHARMLPISSLFSKFPRLVREVARAAGKQVELQISGETTELDRAVIEAIGDPLMHLLRNAVDHGIEPPEVRQAAGKSPSGAIRLAATAVEGQVAITVSDDGRGIDPARIRQAAITRGLLSAEAAAQLDDDEAIDLIFRPNLSTASQVTEVSGRGVGMDVVRTNVERLSGSVVVTSEVGQGATFRLTLPLTLALVQTMLVKARGNLYAIPVTGISGALSLAEAVISTVKGRPAIDWQGAVLPLLDLRDFFTHPRLAPANGAGPAGKTSGAIILVTWGKLRVGLIVDKIIGQQEIVVKALSSLIGPLPGLAGATILGDGRIALIVDIPGLVNTALLARKQGDLCTLNIPANPT